MISQTEQTLEFMSSLVSKMTTVLPQLQPAGPLSCQINHPRIRRHVSQSKSKPVLGSSKMQNNGQHIVEGCSQGANTCSPSCCKNALFGDLTGSTSFSMAIKCTGPMDRTSKARPSGSFLVLLASTPFDKITGRFWRVSADRDETTVQVYHRIQLLSQTRDWHTISVSV